MEPIYHCKYCGGYCFEDCYSSHRRIHDCHDPRCKGYRPAVSRSSSQYGYSREHVSFPPPRRQSHAERGNFCYFKDPIARFEYRYPRDLRGDADHHYLATVHGPLEPGRRYGYDARGGVISFHVSQEASDYCEPRRRDSRRQRHRPAADGMYAKVDGSGAYGDYKVYQEPLPRRPPGRGYEYGSQWRHRPQGPSGRAHRNDDRHRDEGSYRDDCRHRDDGGHRDEEVRGRGKPRRVKVVTPYEVESPQPSPKKKSVKEEKDWEIETITWRIGQL